MVVEGISERSVEGGLVGPTFGCIIANQFENLRKCDRFWYETRQKKLGFTTKQLNQIKKVTLSSLLCNNLDNQETKFQLKIFDLPNETRNPLISCKEHPKIDLKFWSKQNGKQSFCDVNGQLFKLGEKGRIGACTFCDCPKTGKVKLGIKELFGHSTIVHYLLSELAYWSWEMVHYLAVP